MAIRAACWGYALAVGSWFFIVLGVADFIIATLLAKSIRSTMDEIPAWAQQGISDGLMLVILGGTFAALFVLLRFFQLFSEQGVPYLFVLALGTASLVEAILAYYVRVRFLKK